ETDPDFIDFIKDIQKVFQVKLSDVDFNFWVDISNGKIEYDLKIHPDPNVVILMTKKVLTDFILEKIDPAISYMAGKINIIGSVSDALLLGKMLKYSTTKMLE
ncbi:MAG: SCP2 sterol-binding domain-containing protein, partial [Candidatus Lokiarchaeota archaeon]|nr:SCP2 sterol-binding domain-containing protein [Candidatus Lokiarchaeota archaeon]